MRWRRLRERGEGRRCGGGFGGVGGSPLVAPVVDGDRSNDGGGSSYGCGARDAGAFEAWPGIRSVVAVAVVVIVVVIASGRVAIWRPRPCPPLFIA